MTLELKSKRKFDMQAVNSEFSISVKALQGIPARADECQRLIVKYTRLRNQDLIMGEIENARKLTREILALQSRLVVMGALQMVDCRVHDVAVSYFEWS